MGENALKAYGITSDAFDDLDTNITRLFGLVSAVLNEIRVLERHVVLTVANSWTMQRGTTTRASL